MVITEAEALAIQPNVYYTVDEVAKLLRVSSASVRRLLVERPIGVKIGRHWRILGAALSSSWPRMKRARSSDSRPDRAGSLYPRLLGPAWNTVDGAVRRAHLDGRVLRRTGLFRVRHGGSAMARLLLSILPLPAAADAVSLELVIQPLGCGEQWVRRFGDRTWVTTQTERSGGVLAERFGTIELQFQLEVSDGALIYRQVGAVLRWGPLSLSLPGWLSPRVEAHEAARGRSRTHVSVTTAVPFAGLLIAYDGCLDEEGRG